MIETAASLKILSHRKPLICNREACLVKYFW